LLLPNAKTQERRETKREVHPSPIKFVNRRTGNLSGIVGLE
jgi:hypothetical protein